MLIDQISLQPYDVGAIIIPIFTNEEAEAQGLSNLLSLGNDETVVQTSLGQWSSGGDELHLFKDPHPLPPPSPFALNLSQHQGLFQSQLLASDDQNIGSLQMNSN